MIKINHCFLSTDFYFPFILFLTFVPYELRRMLADPCVVSYMSKLACQAVFFFLSEVIIPVCALALSLRLNLRKEVFGAGVSLRVFV